MSFPVYSCATSKDAFIRNNYQDREKVKDVAFAILQDLTREEVWLNCSAVLGRKEEADLYPFTDQAVANIRHTLDHHILTTHFSTVATLLELGLIRTYYDYVARHKESRQLSRLELFIALLLSGYAVTWRQRHSWCIETCFLLQWNNIIF